MVDFVITCLVERCARVFKYDVTCPFCVRCRVDDHLNESIWYVKSNLDFFLLGLPFGHLAIENEFDRYIFNQLDFDNQKKIITIFQQLKFCDHKMFDYQYPFNLWQPNQF
jgi:hypothetical protein